MSTGKGGGGGGKGGSFAPNQSYTPVASGHGYGYYNPQQPLGPSAYNPQMDAYGSRQNVMQPMSGYYNQYQLPGSNYQPYQPPAPQPAPQPYQPFQPPAPQPQPNPGYFNTYNPFSSPFSNQGGHYNTFGGGYGNSYAHFTPDYGGQQNFYEPTPNYFGRPVQNPFQAQTQTQAPAPAPAPAQNYNYSTEPDEVYEEPMFNIRATDIALSDAPKYNRFAEGNQAPILSPYSAEASQAVEDPTVLNVLKMATNTIPSDMQYDENNDGRLSSRDALLLHKKSLETAEPEIAIAPNPAPESINSAPDIYQQQSFAPHMPILDYQQPTVQQSYEQAIAGRQQPQYVAPEPRIYGHQRATQMPILDSADQASTSAPDPGFDGYDPNMYYQPMLFGGIYL